MFTISPGGVVYLLVSPHDRHNWSFVGLHILYVFQLLPGGLFFARAHVNRWWTSALEFTALLQGTFVAVRRGNDLWPMFAFGFDGIFYQCADARLGPVARCAHLFLAAIRWIGHVCIQRQQPAEHSPGDMDTVY